jgi:hypothetical protein
VNFLNTWRVQMLGSQGNIQNIHYISRRESAVFLNCYNRKQDTKKLNARGLQVWTQQENFLNIKSCSRAPVAHTCNSKLLRRQRWGESWFKASPGKWFVRPYLKGTHHKKRAGRVAQGVGPEFKPQYLKNK